jgi:thiopurine S-methyltransferase
MEPQFWLSRWRDGQIGFHQPQVDRSLQRHWPALRLGPPGSAQGKRVFVPLCGKSLDLLWLRDQGHEVAGIELAAIALEAFWMENGIPARRRPRGDFDVYQAGHLKLIRGDFFRLTPSLLGDVDALYDRAALISWMPELRQSYVAHIAALARPGTPMLLIALEYEQSHMQGPPFSVAREEVERLYAPRFAIRELDRRDVLESEPRMRSRGLTALTEVCYHLVLQ